ncbi:TetR/AcrR family transcriptional regulator [Propionicicella superfundia]|uniref:TetR/AcrR family transcriptional regulator n=1 Tax=Propionicicella superfundia TaxID=348582 RepID=UPI00146BAC45|nr:TetR/AcrR family transcriptional regulator [Propionicicella superfundia]
MSDTTPPRRQRLPKAQRRVLLLEAATMVFAQEGYHNASMEAMARAAGVTKPVLYQHFPSKLDLLRAVATESTLEVERVVTAAMNDNLSSGTPFESAIEALFDFAERRPHQFLLVYETELPQDDQVQHTILEGTARVVTHGIPIIKAHTGLDQNGAALLAWSIIGMTTFAVRHWKRANDGTSKADALVLALELLHSGLSGWESQG